MPSVKGRGAGEKENLKKEKNKSEKRKTLFCPNSIEEIDDEPLWGSNVPPGARGGGDRPVLHTVTSSVQTLTFLPFRYSIFFFKRWVDQPVHLTLHVKNN